MYRVSKPGYPSSYEFVQAIYNNRSSPEAILVPVNRFPGVEVSTNLIFSTLVVMSTCQKTQD